MPRAQGVGPAARYLLSFMPVPALEGSVLLTASGGVEKRKVGCLRTLGATYMGHNATNRRSNAIARRTRRREANDALVPILQDRRGAQIRGA